VEFDGASMGPRPLGHGNSRSMVNSAESTRASMGPRPLGHGNGERAYLHYGEETRFNGAAASRPRKPSTSEPATRSMSWLQWGRGLSATETWLPPEQRPLTTRFNGAAASRPRKHGIEWTEDVKGYELQWGRGLSATETPLMIAGATTRSNTLQWGRGLSATETSERYPSSLAGTVLQWGRGLSATETPRGGCKVSHRAEASMGPRPLGHGNGRTQANVIRIPGSFNGAAASRPRKPPSQQSAAIPTRCFNGAAASRPRKRPRPGPPAGRPSCRFNGAAASRPRKPASFRRASRRATHPLQWGRGLSATETGRCSRHSRCCTPRFNGAAASRPRKPRASCAGWVG